MAPEQGHDARVASTGQERNPLDRFNKSLLDSDKYPENLLLRTAPRGIVQGYQDYLDKNDDLLFRNDRHRLVLWELWGGYPVYQQTEITALKPLKYHLDRQQIDPIFRHVFLESDHSRAPLNCSSATLKFLLTYHQVDPSFLDDLFSFGDQEEPADACLSQFQFSNTLSSGAQLPAVPTLGRSGREIRYSLLLRGTERAPEAGWPWSTRQAALYHSFDVYTGKCLWINVKGNDLLQKRVIDDVIDYLPREVEQEGRLENCFVTSLAVLLVYFTWCEENDRWCVRDIEDAIRDIMIKAKTAPIDKKPHFEGLRSPRAPRGLAAQVNRRRTFATFFPEVAEASLSAVSPSFRRKQVSDLEAKLKSYPHTTTVQQVPEKNDVPEELVLEMFNYKDLQDLNVMGEKVEEAILIVKLNRRTLQEVLQFLERLINIQDVPDMTREVFKRHVPPFLDKGQAVIRRLETRQTQLESLYSKLSEGKTLFENLLQYRGLQVSRIFAEHARETSKTMERMAEETLQDSVSMHIITFLALVFLPGTFVATFFSSGVLAWDQSESASQGGSWLFRSDAFALFMEIVLPMTFAVLLAWYAVYWHNKTKVRRRITGIGKDGN